jgi:hypothetical protein
LGAPCIKRFCADPQSFSDFTDRITTLDNLRHSILLKLIRISNPFAHIHLSLVPKLPSKASINLGACQSQEVEEWLTEYRKAEEDNSDDVPF